MKLRALLIDDEAPNLENLGSLIRSYCSSIDVSGAVSSVNEALAFLERQEIDAVFLDIEMPQRNGFTLLPALQKKNIPVVFVTAHSRYAIQALKASALDYLLKPVDIDELAEAEQKLMRHHQVKAAGAPERYSALLDNLESGRILQKLLLPQQSGLSVIAVTDIVSLEGDDCYTTFFLADGRRLMVSRTLKEYETMLESNAAFFRIHKSHIVNLEHVTGFSGDHAELGNGQRLPVSRRKKQGFLLELRRHFPGQP